MNPVDHPHGGGGKTAGGILFRELANQQRFKTRDNKRTDKYIIRTG